MVENEIYETVREYSLFISGLDHKIHAKISKVVNSNDFFEWSISNFCKLDESASTVYIPSSRNGKSFEETETLLFAYLNSFTSIDVTPNKYY